MWKKTAKTMSLALVLALSGCSDEMKEAASALPLFAVPPRVQPVPSEERGAPKKWVVSYAERMCTAAPRHPTLGRCSE